MGYNLTAYQIYVGGFYLITFSHQWRSFLFCTLPLQSGYPVYQTTTKSPAGPIVGTFVKQDSAVSRTAVYLHRSFQTIIKMLLLSFYSFHPFSVQYPPLALRDISARRAVSVSVIRPDMLCCYRVVYTAALR